MIETTRIERSIDELQSILEDKKVDAKTRVEAGHVISDLLTNAHELKMLNQTRGMLDKLTRSIDE